MATPAKKEHPKKCLLSTDQTIFTTTLICLATASNIVFSSMVFAADNYLDELSMEAESSAHVLSSTRHNAEYDKKLRAMEAQLKNKKPATYKFYKKLSSEHKNQIFEHYSADNLDEHKQWSSIQKNVMDLYFKQQ